MFLVQPFAETFYPTLERMAAHVTPDGTPLSYEQLCTVFFLCEYLEDHNSQPYHANTVTKVLSWWLGAPNLDLRDVFFEFDDPDSDFTMETLDYGLSYKDWESWMSDSEELYEDYCEFILQVSIRFGYKPQLTTLQPAGTSQGYPDFGPRSRRSRTTIRIPTLPLPSLPERILISSASPATKAQALGYVRRRSSYGYTTGSMRMAQRSESA